MAGVEGSRQKKTRRDVLLMALTAAAIPTATFVGKQAWSHRLGLLENTADVVAKAARLPDPTAVPTLTPDQQASQAQAQFFDEMESGVRHLDTMQKPNGWFIDFGKIRSLGGEPLTIQDKDYAISDSLIYQDYQAFLINEQPTAMRVRQDFTEAQRKRASAKEVEVTIEPGNVLFSTAPMLVDENGDDIVKRNYPLSPGTYLIAPVAGAIIEAEMFDHVTQRELVATNKINVVYTSQSGAKERHPVGWWAAMPGFDTKPRVYVPIPFIWSFNGLPLAQQEI